MNHARFVLPLALCTSFAISISGCTEPKPDAVAAGANEGPTPAKADAKADAKPDAKADAVPAKVEPDGAAAEGVKLGERPANFKSKNQDGKEVDLWSYRGKSPVMLAFYPKNFTGG